MNTREENRSSRAFQRCLEFVRIVGDMDIESNEHFDLVLRTLIDEALPPGRGGVGIANAKSRKAILAQIPAVYAQLKRDWLEERKARRDSWAEPTYQWEFA